MSRLDNISLDGIDELEGVEEMYETVFGFVPNGVRIMARRPGIVQGFLHLRRSVFDPDTSEVPLELKSLVGHIASKTAGCRYCQAHTIRAAERYGAVDEQMEHIWEYRTHAAFSDGERAALDLALAAGSVPNAVDEALQERVQAHWDDGEIVEILGVIALFGYLNRWNDSMATTLEEGAVESGQQWLTSDGWDRGKHV